MQHLDKSHASAVHDHFIIIWFFVSDFEMTFQLMRGEKRFERHEQCILSGSQDYPYCISHANTHIDFREKLVQFVIKRFWVVLPDVFQHFCPRFLSLKAKAFGYTWLQKVHRCMHGMHL